MEWKEPYSLKIKRKIFYIKVSIMFENSSIREITGGFYSNVIDVAKSYCGALNGAYNLGYCECKLDYEL